MSFGSIINKGAVNVCLILLHLQLICIHFLCIGSAREWINLPTISTIESNLLSHALKCSFDENAVRSLLLYNKWNVLTSLLKCSCRFYRLNLLDFIYTP